MSAYLITHPSGEWHVIRRAPDSFEVRECQIRDIGEHEIALRMDVQKALLQISGGLTYFSAAAKHAQLLDAQQTLQEALKCA